MQASRKLFCISMILCVLVTECFGLGVMAKDKRGWTLNSAGYLLGPYASNDYRNLNAKGGLAGKRDNLYHNGNPDSETLYFSR
uniref:Galanin peptides-like protein n=1 Tax=Callorhinchus milii TaxID=7868 RepID=V9LKZ7_CALMI